MTAAAAHITPQAFERYPTSQDMKAYPTFYNIPNSPGVAAMSFYKLRYCLWHNNMLDRAILGYGNAKIDVQGNSRYDMNDLAWLQERCACIRASTAGTAGDLAYRFHCSDMGLPYERNDGKSVKRMPVVFMDEVEPPKTLLRRICKVLWLVMRQTCLLVFRFHKVVFVLVVVWLLSSQIIGPLIWINRIGTWIAEHLQSLLKWVGLDWKVIEQVAVIQAVEWARNILWNDVTQYKKRMCMYWCHRG